MVKNEAEISRRVFLSAPPVVLTSTERCLSLPVQSVYITHGSVGFEADDDAVDRVLPGPFRAARGGPEVMPGSYQEKKRR